MNNVYEYACMMIYLTHNMTAPRYYTIIFLVQ